MAAPFELPALPYDDTALAPVIGQQTVQLHHGKHHKTYFDKLNPLVDGTEMADMSLEDVIRHSAGKADLAGVFNNAGQAWNHILYWEQFSTAGAREASGKLAEMIGRDFGSFGEMKDKLVATGAGVFGSGWAWLALDGDKLVTMGTGGGDNPLAHGKVALCGIDVWEHAYYLDYQNRRPDHIKAVLDDLVNWSFVGEKLDEALG